MQKPKHLSAFLKNWPVGKFSDSWQHRWMGGGGVAQDTSIAAKSLWWQKITINFSCALSCISQWGRPLVKMAEATYSSPVFGQQWYAKWCYLKTGLFYEIFCDGHWFWTSFFQGCVLLSCMVGSCVSDPYPHPAEAKLFLGRREYRNQIYFLFELQF
jgi:hypothetical protein